MKPFFSLVLPCYQVEKYVETCVASILAQDFRDYEIILVDDGSADETPHICDRLAKEHACIRVLHQKNGGLASARNAGLEMADGRYVWFVDSDDMIEPGALAEIHEACVASEADIVKFGYYRNTGDKSCAGMLMEPGLYAGEAEFAQLRRMAFGAPAKYGLSVWAHVYRRAFLQAHALQFTSEKLVCSEDYLFNFQALFQAEKMAVLDRLMYVYMLRAGSVTQRYKSDLAARHEELHRRLKEVCVQEGPLVDRFYVWHLTAGTCIPHEYRHGRMPEEISQCRRRVRAILKRSALRKTIVTSDRSGLTFRKKVILAAMYLGFEPLFYYLHVVRPAKADSWAKE